MFMKKRDQSIYVTRGDSCSFPVSAVIDGEIYTFKVGDFVRFKVVMKNDCSRVVLQKDTKVLFETEEVEIFLSGAQTKLGDVISRPMDYWYEIELNPETEPKTIVGYDEDGAKIFRLYPEGADAGETEEGELPTGTLTDLVAEALERAKASGIFNGTDGLDGADGTDGEDGADGYTPLKGVDYYTEADKAEMVQAVLAAMPQYAGETEEIA